MKMKPKAKNFHFIGYKFDAKDGKTVFNYRAEFYNQDSLDFSETVILPKIPHNLKEESIRKILESLLIVLGISYYKLYCPPQITMPFLLSKDQADFWNTVYTKGLGEFFYRNRLSLPK